MFPAQCAINSYCFFLHFLTDDADFFVQMNYKKKNRHNSYSKLNNKSKAHSPKRIRVNYGSTTIAVASKLRLRYAPPSCGQLQFVHEPCRPLRHELRLKTTEKKPQKSIFFFSETKLKQTDRTQNRTVIIAGTKGTALNSPIIHFCPFSTW